MNECHRRSLAAVDVNVVVLLMVVVLREFIPWVTDVR